MFTSTSFYWYMSPFVTDKDDTQHWWERDSCVPRCETPGLIPYKDTDEPRPGGALLEVQTLTSWCWGHLWWKLGCHSHTLMIRPHVPFPGIPAEKEQGGRTRGRAARITGEAATALQTASFASFRACPALQLAAPPRSPCGSSRK